MSNNRAEREYLLQVERAKISRFSEIKLTYEKAISLASRIEELLDEIKTLREKLQQANDKIIALQDALRDHKDKEIITIKFDAGNFSNNSSNF